MSWKETHPLGRSTRGGRKCPEGGLELVIVLHGWKKLNRTRLVLAPPRLAPQFLNSEGFLGQKKVRIELKTIGRISFFSFFLGRQGFPPFFFFYTHTHTHTHKYRKHMGCIFLGESTFQKYNPYPCLKIFFTINFVITTETILIRNVFMVL